MKKQHAEGGVAVIKKYANRRLYNTESSSYITLEHLAAMTRAGRDFKVVDARTEEDITHNILTQIIMEEESRGETMLPVDFLRQLIAMYGGSMQSVVPGYLAASLDSLKRNQDQFRSAVEGAWAGSPFAELVQRNMAMLDAATSAFKPPFARQPGGSGAGASTSAKDREIAELKAELARLRAKVDKLGASNP